MLPCALKNWLFKWKNNRSDDPDIEKNAFGTVLSCSCVENMYVKCMFKIIESAATWHARYKFFYCRVIQNKRWGMLTEGILQLHDNAKPHTATQTRTLLEPCWAISIFSTTSYIILMANTNNDEEDVKPAMPSRLSEHGNKFL